MTNKSTKNDLKMLIYKFLKKITLFQTILHLWHIIFFYKNILFRENFHKTNNLVPLFYNKEEISTRKQYLYKKR